MIAVAASLVASTASLAADGRIMRPWSVSFGSSFNASSRLTGYGHNQSNWFNLRASIGCYLTPKTHVQIWVQDSRSEYQTAYRSIGGFDQIYKQHHLILSLDAVRTFLSQGKFSVRAGGGAGIQRTSINQVFQNPWMNRSSNTYRYNEFQYNFSVGVNYQINSRFSVQADYRLSTTSGEQMNRFNQTVSVSISVQVGKPQSL